jgi:AcrR family transcriptional regulator
MVRKPSPDKKEQLLSSALKLFVAHGVGNTPTNAIAREAGVAAGTLFLYFPTKQDLIHELVLKIGKEQSETIKSLPGLSGSVREIFFSIWEGSIRWFLDNSAAYQYIRQVRDSGLIAEQVVRESEKFFDYYYIAIQKGLAEESIKAYPLELIGSLLYQDVVAVMDLILAQPDPVKQNEYIHFGFEAFWDGIKASQSNQGPFGIVEE